MLSNYKIVSHKFTSWDTIPNVDHLRQIEDANIDSFAGDVVFVCYALDANGGVVAFGSGGYYEKENYYEDDENDDEFYGDQRSRHLWIEGLVSTVKGLGRLVLCELERILINFSIKMHSAGKITEYRVINVMSVEDSVGFYENCGYSVCSTTPRFAGPGNIRCAKAFNGDNLDKQCVIKYDVFSNEWCLYNFLVLGRRKMCDDYLNIPKDIENKDFVKYFISNKESKDLFKDNINEETRQQLVEWVINCKEECDY